jgi:copper homeostasis protein CutC
MDVHPPNRSPHLELPLRYVLEIAISTPDEAICALEGGADRLELSSGLEIGGLTPSRNAFRQVHQAVSLPVYVLIRPRPGGFHYSDREFTVMLGDAEEFLEMGAEGIVFGILSPTEIDRQRCQQLVELAKGRAVFHRAFDFLPEPLVALDKLIELGFERVLTSGQGITAAEGASRLALLIQYAKDRIEVLPGGSIRPANVAKLIRETACDQIHSSARSTIIDPELNGNFRLALGMGIQAAANRMTTDRDVVAGLRRALDQFARDPNGDDPVNL